MEEKGNVSQIRKMIAEKWKKILLVDRGRLRSLRHHVENELIEKGSSGSLEKLTGLLDRYSEKYLGNKADRMRILFPENLPITAKIPDVRKALAGHQVVVVCGTTGSGKTTQLPKAALAEGFGRVGRIGCTQPRRLAATALAERLAEETGTVFGEEVGCKIRFDDRTTDSTVIKFMTDGILLAETRSDPLLLGYDCIILDEVHERSLNIDFLLGYLKLLLEKRHDLRIIISSATLESGRISEFFGGAPVIEVEGGLYPIEDCYMPPEEEEDLPDNIARAVQFLLDLDDSGDILVFLPGEREIREALDRLEGKQYKHVEILPLFGRLSASEQNQIFRRSRLRRIILSTNVAETSLTIPGIRFVIDSGLVRLSRYNPKSRIQELRVEPVSQASARQRRGRCGRLRDGVCVRLYSEEALSEASPYTAPEIQRTSLAGVILQMASLKLPPIEGFPFVDPPSPALIKEGMRTLDDLHAIESGNRLTGTGARLAAMPLDPHLGKMLIEGEHAKILPEMLVISSFLSIADPKERPFEHAKAADDAQKAFASDVSDFFGILKLWSAVTEAMGNSHSRTALRKFAKKNYLNFRRLTEWRNLVDDLADLFHDVPSPDTLNLETAAKNYDRIHKTILSGLPRNLALFDPETRLYSDMNGKKFMIFPGSGLSKRKNPPKWLLTFTVVETTKVFARCNAEVKPEWLEEVAPRLCKATYDNVYWDEKSGFVYARERLSAGQLLINPGRRRHYGKIDPAASREVFIREGLAQGRAFLHGCRWLEKYNKMYADLRGRELKTRHPDSIVDPESIFRFFDGKLPPEMCSIEAVKRTPGDFAPSEEDITWEHEEFHPEDFPDQIECANMKFRLSYLFDCDSERDGITIFIPESCLNLFDPHRADYLVPGYLLWKAEFMLRNLPKAVRREINPVAECAKTFADACKSGDIFTERPLADALAEFLRDYYEVQQDPGVFDEMEFPPYLVMKIAVCNGAGKVVRLLDRFPGRDSMTTKLSNHLPAARKYSVSGSTTWPFLADLPYEVEAAPKSGKMAYPALMDEGESVGCSLFLDESDAVYHHKNGLLRLFRLRFPQLGKALKQMIKVPHDLELSFFLDDPEWKEYLADDAMLLSLECAPEDIRSPGEFEKAADQVSSHAAQVLNDAVKELEDIYDSYERTVEELNRIREGSETAADVNLQLDFLFRKGFLRCPDAVGNYKRYLKSLAVRLQRAQTSSLQKDLDKGAEIADLIRKFHVACDSCEGGIERQPALYEFFLLLEETRITAYTPELKSAVKATPARLRAAWDALSLR